MSRGLLDDHEQRYAAVVLRLRQARIDSGLTQEYVAGALGKSQSFVSRSEQGARRVDIVELKAFADLYGKTLSDFLV
jgi:transcriptional regulator with XRE-family HTH domain